ncbi:hypothetical protein [Enterococcus ureasiticus]|uniref:Uncharacterized protein n=1 Tax=Enterococcus ureasiticus TaxID=903984 RepID=A0A1E5GAC0_9ENTE|nr:hypothetical protein [Enterococcus ureasiticus]OEG09658.1 hypothetical protein BCR21_15055 [Enterococcus ureasiticus]
MDIKTEDSRKWWAFIGKVLFILGGWSLYFAVFVHCYKEIVFYLDKQANGLIQFLFLLSYSGYEIMWLTIGYVIMLLGSTLLLLWNPQTRKLKPTLAKQEIVLSILLIFVAIVPIGTRLWSFFLMAFVLAFTIGFIACILLRQEENDEMVGQEDEVVNNCCGMGRNKKFIS